jgi:hypothetical protein
MAPHAGDLRNTMPPQSLSLADSTAISPQRSWRLWLAWTIAGGLLGITMFGVAEALLHRHLPIPVGALGGLLVGGIEGYVITRNLGQADNPTKRPRKAALGRWSRVELDLPSAPPANPRTQRLARSCWSRLVGCGLATVAGMALLLAALLAPSLGLALAATVLALIAGGLLQTTRLQ